MKLLLLTALAAVASADPYYGYGYPVLGNSPTLQWPGYSAPGFSRQTFGLRGKRSAEPEPEPYYGFYGYYRPYLYGPGVAGHPGGATSYTQRSPQGIGKRSAEPEPYYGYYGYYPYRFGGVAGHPTGISYTQRSPQGIGKRSAEPHYPLYHPYLHVPGVAAHPTGTSYTHQSPQGLGKRSADEEEPAKGVHPNGGTSYVGRTVWGFPAEAKTKRSAEPEPYYPYYYHQQNWPSVRLPGFSSTVYGARGKRSAEPYVYNGPTTYGYPSYYRGYYGRGYYWG